MNIKALVRKNILNLKPYSSARSEYKGEASVFLDANENPLSKIYNRYPDPLQSKLKEKIATIKEISPKNIFLGNGSDEPIDLVVRIFCEPRIDNIVAIAPTYGMYKVTADVNDVEYRSVSLGENYSFDADKFLAATDKNTKLIFLCSPNNPTGNLLDTDEIKKVLKSFDGMVVLDEAYIDFAIEKTCLPELLKYPNLIILQTFSKAWGIAAIRLGMAFASEEVIGYFNRVKYPYNINQLVQDFALKELDRVTFKNEWVNTLLGQKTSLKNALTSLPFVEKIHHSDANFLLVKVNDPDAIYNFLTEKGIVVRNRNNVLLCEGCLRITVGSLEENEKLLDALRAM